MQNRGTLTGDAYATVYILWDDSGLGNLGAVQPVGAPLQIQTLQAGEFRVFPTGVTVDPPPGAERGSIIVILHTAQNQPLSLPAPDPTGVELQRWVAEHPEVAWRWFSVDDGSTRGGTP